MSEQTMATATDAPTAPVEQEPAPEQVKPTETVDFWKKQARENERRAKENAEAARKLQEFEDRDKTEAQKIVERATAAEQRAAEFELKATRLEVAFEKGLTPAQAKRLVGSTREELEADADEVLRDFPVKPAEPATPARPSGDIAQGARQTAPPTDPRARDLAQIEADLKAGGRR